MDPLISPPETVLVTGANRGIGLALVSELLALGYRVIATARRPDTAHDLQALAVNHPDRLQIFPLEVTSDASLQHAAAQVGQLDILINNAAVFPEEGEELFEKWQAAHLLEAFSTNVIGVTRVTQTFLPQLRQSPRARVLNISSTAGSISGKHSHFYYAYSTSKAALNMLTRTMAFDLATQGITVVAITPGWVQTDMGGSDAKLTPHESASALAALAGRITPADAGTFLERDGKPCPHAW